jgi:hypothetical protein
MHDASEARSSGVGGENNPTQFGPLEGASFDNWDHLLLTGPTDYDILQHLLLMIEVDSDSETCKYTHDDGQCPT